MCECDRGMNKEIPVRQGRTGWEKGEERQSGIGSTGGTTCTSHLHRRWQDGCKTDQWLGSLGSSAPLIPGRQRAKAEMCGGEGQGEAGIGRGALVQPLTSLRHN